MKKIKGFKLALRPRDIQRRAKSIKLDLEALGLKEESALEDRLASLRARLKPAVLYETFRAEAAGSLPRWAPMPGVAASGAVVTLGVEMDRLLDSAATEPEAQGRFLGLLCDAALDEAVRFVLSLVEEEAKEEKCDLSPLSLVTEPSSLKALLDTLSSQKIGVGLSDGGLVPSSSRAFGVSWLAKSKAKAK